MGIRSSSITIVTESLVATRQFYERHFQAQRLFDCGWYVVLRLSGPAAQEISLMRPQQGMEPFRGGAYVNLEVEDVDQLYANLTCAGLEAVSDWRIPAELSCIAISALNQPTNSRPTSSRPTDK